MAQLTKVWQAHSGPGGRGGNWVKYHLSGPCSGSWTEHGKGRKTGVVIVEMAQDQIDALHVGSRCCRCFRGDDMEHTWEIEDWAVEYEKLKHTNAALLSALQGLVAAFEDNPNKPRNSKDWDYLINTELFAAGVPQARAAILAAKGEANNV